MDWLGLHRQAHLETGVTGHRIDAQVAVKSSDELRQKLARFYAERTLTKKPITVADQAEAYFLLLSNRLSKTTGQILAVDGGLHEAFLR